MGIICNKHAESKDSPNVEFSAWYARGLHRLYIIYYARKEMSEIKHPIPHSRDKTNKMISLLQILFDCLPVHWRKSSDIPPPKPLVSACMQYRHRRFVVRTMQAEKPSCYCYLISLDWLNIQLFLHHLPLKQAVVCMLLMI